MSSLKSRFSYLLAASTLVLGACATTNSTPEAPIDLANNDQRAAAERADPLTRARFWASEYQKEPENIETAKYFAKALRDIESHDRVIRVVSDTLILYPADYDLLMLLGKSYVSLNKADAASQAFGRAISVDNSRPDAFAALGLAYDRAAQHTFAQRAYKKALEIDPNRTATLTNYGLSLALSGDIATAETVLRKAADRPDANTQVRQNLALVLGLQGKFDEMKSVDAGAPSDIMESNAKVLEQMVGASAQVETKPSDTGTEKAEVAKVANATPERQAPTKVEVSENVPASKPASVAEILSTAPKPVAKPESETLTAQAPNFLRGSLDE